MPGRDEDSYTTNCNCRKCVNEREKRRDCHCNSCCKKRTQSCEHSNVSRCCKNDVSENCNCDRCIEKRCHNDECKKGKVIVITIN